MRDYVFHYSIETNCQIAQVSLVYFFSCEISIRVCSIAIHRQLYDSFHFEEDHMEITRGRTTWPRVLVAQLVEYRSGTPPAPSHQIVKPGDSQANSLLWSYLLSFYSL